MEARGCGGSGGGGGSNGGGDPNDARPPVATENALGNAHFARACGLGARGGWAEVEAAAALCAPARAAPERMQGSLTRALRTSAASTRWL
jgi:hypothetical protein